ncbi:MAG: glucose 1-dehydrogenase [Acidobacteriota bacterium]|jgi:NAD(P)-dependent dehydrogenase (short-subunit alcohol dehydrogenase family)
MESSVDLNYVQNMFSIKDKVAVVTGGAGALGKAVALGLAVYGADVVVTGRTMKTLEPVVRDIEAVGRRALALSCDVAVEEDVANMVRETLKGFGTVDILVTVAGIAKRFPAEEFPIADWQQVMDVNVRGTFLCCKHVAKIFKEKKKGKIVTISSVRAFAGHPSGYAAYGTSKGAVNLLTKQLATEWAKYNINVNSIAPCIFWTPLTQEVLENEQMYKVFMSRIPMGRAALTQDSVGAAVYLSSPASDFVTGQILYVDGGTVAG